MIRVAALTAVLLAPLAAQSDPAEAARLLTRAEALEAQGATEDACAVYASLAEQQPDEVRWVLAQARLHRAAGRLGRAIHCLQSATARFAEDAELNAQLATTLHLRAEAMLATGVRDDNVRFHYERAAAVAERTLTAHPERRDLLLLVAHSRFQLGDVAAAGTAAEQAIERFPDHPGGFIIRGQLALHDYTTLRGELAESADGDPGDLEERAAAAHARAVAAFAEAARLDPARALPHSQLGNLAAWQQQTERALQHYLDALTRDPGVALDHRWLARTVSAARRQEWYAEAARLYRARDDADPRAAAHLDWWRGLAALEAGEHTAAYAALTGAADANPALQSGRAYAMLAAFHNQDHDSAELQAASYAARDPQRFADLVRDDGLHDDLLAVIEFLAHRAYRDQRIDRSRDLNHVVAMVRATAEHWNNYAFLCRETERFEDSINAYRNALTVDPDSPQLLNDAGVVLHYHLPNPDNLKRARRYYYEAIEAAEKVLADGTSTPEAIALAEKAMTDAKHNLAELEKAR